jgi:uncharacterized protein with PQ loop repeat
VETRLKHSDRELEHCALLEVVLHLLRLGDRPALHLTVANEVHIGLPLPVLGHLCPRWHYSMSVLLESILYGNVRSASARSTRLISPIFFVTSSPGLSLFAMMQIFVRVIVGDVTAELTTLLLLPQMLARARAHSASELLSFTSPSSSKNGKHGDEDMICN